jgi:hypothetical protein
VKPNPDENGGELSVVLEVDEVELKGSRPARGVEVDEWEPRCIGVLNRSNRMRSEHDHSNFSFL